MRREAERLTALARDRATQLHTVTQQVEHTTYEYMCTEHHTVNKGERKTALKYPAQNKNEA